MATINTQTGMVTLNASELSILAQARNLNIKKMGLNGRILEKKAQTIVNQQLKMQAQFREEQMQWSGRR